VPGGESQKEQGGGEGVGAPNQQVGKRNREVDEKEKNKKRDSGGAMKNPTRNPWVAGSVRNAENKCGRKEKPRGEADGRLGKEEGQEREEAGGEPRNRMAKQKGHGSA
jgi:hypothetical protein